MLYVGNGAIKDNLSLYYKHACTIMNWIISTGFAIRVPLSYNVMQIFIIIT